MLRYVVAGAVLLPCCVALADAVPTSAEVAGSWRGDLMVARQPGQNARAYIGQLDARAGLTRPGAAGLPLVFELSGFYNDGGELSGRVGDLQVASNLEAGAAGARLNEAWFEHGLPFARASVRSGVMDLNAEFDVLETAQLFLNSAFGIGTDIGQTGANGPSIFPTTGLGVRLAASPAPGLLLRAVAFDGVPGDPERPTRLHIDLDRDEGALLAGELDYQPDPDRFRLFAGHWRYTRHPRTSLSTRPGAEANRGFYLGIEGPLSRSRAARRVHGFARAGSASAAYNPFDRFVSAGVMALLPRPDADPHTLGIGVATAFTGVPQRALMRRQSGRARPYEAVLEITYRWPLMRGLALQPTLQYVRYPAGAPGRRDATVWGLRLEVAGRREFRP